MEDKDRTKSNFIRDIIDQDLQNGKNDGKVHTRFPPEPNGHLHIGHAKAILVNYSIAQDYNGKFNLRFDDTNPIKEDEEFVNAIINDIKWLGADWEDRLFYASDYFEQMYEYAVQLIKAGKAFVDSQSAEEIRANRGSVTSPGVNSPFRDRSIEENLDLFEKMRDGDFEDGSHVLRGKIDMASPNMLMRDPLMYRIRHTAHHRTGNRWCIYPMYDWAHGLEDSIEGITHSLCSLEFQAHRPLYDWYLDQLNVHHPQQIEFARLNLNYTVMSKRKLLELVEENLVNGWDDPRLPTLSGLRRRGFTPEAIQNFIHKVGVAKAHSVVDYALLEHSIREVLNKQAPRVMSVLNPLKVVITNYPEDQVEEIDAVNNPEDPEAGTRKVPFSKELYIEREDFMEDPPKKFFRLAPGREVRFRYAYFITCNEVIKDGNGEILELQCTYDPASKGGKSPDGRKVKATLHWISTAHAIDAEVRLYDRLITIPDTNNLEEGKTFMDFINPDALKVLHNCKLEAHLAKAEAGFRCQFERLGYFCADLDSTESKPIFNRTVTLRDTWARLQKNIGKN
ncbi:MAG: glutamine--tRNA ligase/YqeY domain fusion protein [Candidatus Cloacimonetes bacterium]|jgi:glutaminyl-tRNA synthetase|nr:glutamine--tRNA ligase/YqeY domain fusion protein [Candidatus Cloacimonadota bacterium]